jgi:hypothetical protein
MNGQIARLGVGGWTDRQAGRLWARGGRRAAGGARRGDRQTYRQTGTHLDEVPPLQQVCRDLLLLNHLAGIIPID